MSQAPVSQMSFYRLLAEAWQRQLRVRWDQLRQQRLMFSVTMGFLAVYWIFFTWLFYEGIHFLHLGFPALGELLLARMFYVLFALIFVMLMMSSVIVGYGVFFKNRETAWLQTLPVSHARIFRWKFIETTLLASWAFLFLSGPLLVAYGVVLRLPLFFVPGVLALYLPFSILANVLGVALLLALVWLWHSTWGRRGLILAAVGLFALAVYVFKPIEVGAIKEMEMVPLMNLLLENTRVAMSPMLPSYWLASAVIGLGQQWWGRPVFFCGVTVSYLLLAGWLVLRYSGPFFHENASRVQDHRLHGRAQAFLTRISPLFWTGSFLAGGLRWLGRPVRAILVKDWIVFWRDATQWSQFAIFFGLLAIYFLNLRNFRYQLDERFWISVVSFLNLSSLGMILSTLTTRFVFPQFSLEGRRLWLIGLAPIRLRDVIWGKFWASAVINGGITLGLMIFSFVSLRLEYGLRWMIGFSVVMMSLGLSGIAVGVGVLFPNMRQSNAAQIVSGFGGTFCLILSLAYISTVVILVALSAHGRFVASQSLEFQFASPVSMIYTVVLILSLVAAWLPMRLAERKLDRLEF